ncbi:hypothetical protein FQA39_LY08957 [Lamprigera yunnana]|nr:hypothetical protein FQA39_LY08957 [Lamprigera yunnana]
MGFEPEAVGTGVELARHWATHLVVKGRKLYGTVLTASVMNLVAISYDRLNSIALSEERRLTIKNSKIIIAIVWTMPFIFSMPLFVFRSYRERQWIDFLEQYCTEDVMITNIYWHFVIIVIVWIPLGTMLVCYIALFIKLRQYEQVILRKINTINVHYKKKVAKMMFIVIATFVLCRFPLTALIFYRNHLLKKDNIIQSETVRNQVNGAYYILWFTSRYLMFLNASINPVIYGLTSEKFRKVFRKTTVSKYMFAFKNEEPNNEKLKNKQKINITASSNNHKNIFFIFKNKIHETNLPINETITTNSVSSAPIINS